MLTRPGSNPGPAWMRNISDSLADPERARKVMMPFWVFFILYMLGILVITHFVTAVALSPEHVYESARRMAGLPVISYGPVAHGIIAIGGRATGVIAIGGLAVGFIAFGGVSVGVFAIGGMSVGLCALAGLAIGWRACGGLA
ncbi:MAG: hypothetical protein WBL63_02225, partial [Candidatus Acidiferrum sp.]